MLWTVKHKFDDCAQRYIENDADSDCNYEG